MLRLLSSKAQGCKDFCMPSKPYLVGIHWKALAGYYQMSTNMPGFLVGFQHFCCILFQLAKLATSSIGVKAVTRDQWPLTTTVGP